MADKKEERYTLMGPGGKTYKIEYHPKHQDGNHYDGNHYHVLKLAETPKPGKTKPPYDLLIILNLKI